MIHLQFCIGGFVELDHSFVLSGFLRCLWSVLLCSQLYQLWVNENFEVLTFRFLGQYEFLLLLFFAMFPFLPTIAVRWGFLQEVCRGFLPQQLLLTVF